MDELEKLNEEVDEELQAWNQAGMFLEGIQPSNESLLMLKIQMQTVFNMLLTKTDVTEHDLNVMFKTVMRDTLRELREEFEPEAQRRKVAAITGNEFEVPQLRLLGPDGKPVRI